MHHSRTVCCALLRASWGVPTVIAAATVVNAAASGDGEYARARAPFIHGDVHPFVSAVNNRGEIVGPLYDENGETSICYWHADRGEFLTFHEGIWPDLYLLWFNDSGVLAGIDASGPYAAIRWTKAGGVEILPGRDQEYTRSFAAGINASGQIVGSLWGERYRAVMWEPDGRLVVVAPGFGTDINDRGDIVGFILDPDDRSHDYRPFVAFADGHFVVIALPTNRQPNNLVDSVHINDGGEVAVTAGIRESCDSFVWSRDAGLRMLGSVGGNHYVLAWNNQGEAAGFKKPRSAERLSAFIIQTVAGVEFDLGSALGSFGDNRPVIALNEHGRVVWTHTEGDGRHTPMVWDEQNGAREIRQLVAPHWRRHLQRPAAVNDLGQVAINGLMPGREDTETVMTFLIDLPTEGASPLRFRVDRGSLAEGDLASLASAGDNDVITLRSLDAAPVALAFDSNSRVHRPQSIDLIAHVVADRAGVAFDLELLNHATGTFDRVGGGLPDPATGQLRADLIDARPYINAEGGVTMRLRAESIAAETRPFGVSIDRFAVEVR
jgi:hypothetical protein